MFTTSSVSPVQRKSFRDPAGIVLLHADRVLRLVTRSGFDNLNAFLGSQAIQGGSVVRTALVSNGDREDLLKDPVLRELFTSIDAVGIFEHARIPFPAFPYEWPPEMLEAAGQLTLDLARACLQEGWGLKDATPLNVLFQGTEPVFIDVLSFERRDPRDPEWLPYAQFVRTFLLPLLAGKRFGVSAGQAFLTRRDGIEPEEFYRWLGPVDKLRPLFLTNVSIPVWLGSSRKAQGSTLYKAKRAASADQAGYVLAALFGRLQSALRAAAPRTGRQSAWSDYVEHNNNYTREQIESKQRFVKEALAESAPHSVLDVGSNTGVFSHLAAQSGAAVVAIDYDPVVVGRLWRHASAEKLNILPLVVDITRPTPAVGWNNAEWPSFLDRAAGHFDTVMMLALIHHLLVTERIPLPEIIAMAARLTTRVAIIEFIAPDDAMFQQLARGRDHLHRELTVEVFEEAVKDRFEIVRSRHLPGSHREMYLLKKKD